MAEESARSPSSWAVAFATALCLATVWGQARGSLPSALAHGVAVVANIAALVIVVALISLRRPSSKARGNLVALLLGAALYLPAREFGAYLLRAELLKRLDEFSHLLPQIGPGHSGERSPGFRAAGVNHARREEGYVLLGIEGRGRTAVLHVQHPQQVDDGRYMGFCLRELRTPWYLVRPCPDGVP